MAALQSNHAHEIDFSCCVMLKWMGILEKYVIGICSQKYTIRREDVRKMKKM